jgi:hypothetical protein
MAKTGTATRAAGGYLKKMLGDLIRPAKKRLGDLADGAGDKVRREVVDGVKKSTDKVNKEVDDTLAKVNPKFKKGESAYTENCTSVVQANELRRRGMDVQAGPLEKHLWSSEGGPGGRSSYDIIKNVWGREMVKGGKDDIVKAFEGYGDGARGVARISWNGGGGHIFSIENVGGNVRFIDAQPPGGVRDVSHYFGLGKDTMYARLDDLPTPDAAKLAPYLEPKP